MTPATGTESPRKPSPKKKAPVKKPPSSKKQASKEPASKSPSKPGPKTNKNKKKKASPRPTATRPARAETNDWARLDGRAWWPRPDSARPHVRLGVLWFIVVLCSVAVGPPGIALLYGSIAAVGAAQTTRAWWRRGRRPHLPVAAGAALALPLGACFGSRGLGAAILLAVAASVLVASGSPGQVLAASGTTVRCWLFIGLAAASPVLIAAMDLGAAICLILLVSAYECGDYLVGTDARWPAIGPVAGMVAVGVLSFSLFVFVFPPFGGADVFPFAIALAVLAPLGQVAASLILPDGRALASGLRRLDSLLIAGPAWVVLLWTYDLST